MDGYLVSLLDSFKFAVSKKNTSVVILIDGRSGMGKTTLSNQVGEYVDPNFNIDKICFTAEQFLDRLTNAGMGDCVIFDEAMLLSNRSTMSTLNKTIIQAMSMIRSKQIFVIFNVNSIFDLDRNLVLSRADVLLHVYGDNLIDRGNMAAFFKAKGQQDKLKILYLLGKKYYSYSKPKANFYCRFAMRFVVDLEEYEKRKQEGVNSFLKGDDMGGSKRVLTMVRLIKYIRDEMKISMTKIAEISGLQQSRISQLLQIPT